MGKARETSKCATDLCVHADSGNGSQQQKGKIHSGSQSRKCLIRQHSGLNEIRQSGFLKRIPQVHGEHLPVCNPMESNLKETISR
jgi:hypothetical protein